MSRHEIEYHMDQALQAEWIAEEMDLKADESTWIPLEQKALRADARYWREVSQHHLNRAAKLEEELSK